MKLIRKNSIQLKINYFREGGLIKKYFEGSDLNITGPATQAILSAISSTKPGIIKNSMEDNLDIYHKFGTKNFDELTSILMPLYELTLKKYGYDPKYAEYLLYQAGNESDYGTSHIALNGYNLGGIKWYGNDTKSRSYGYDYIINPLDKKKYIKFKDLLDFADYKVRLLGEDYKAFESKDLDDFIDRLHGNNPSNLYYSESRDNYFLTLNGMKSLRNAYNNYIKNLNNK